MKSATQTVKMRESRIREAAADAKLLMHSADCTYDDFHPCSCDLAQRTQAWRDKFAEIADHNLDTIRSFDRQSRLAELIDDWKRLRVVSEKVA